MDIYDTTSMTLSQVLTLRYSTSFGMSSRLFPSNIRPHIYNIYGLVRIADEVVDTYAGKDMLGILDELERETTRAAKWGYSANPIVHAFALTARRFDFDDSLITAFFASMRMDINPPTYTKALYQTYIYGSAEVIGLMCLAVFCDGDKKKYAALSDGAQHLGAAYQKINFLRDLAADHDALGRLYFPGLTIKILDEAAKHEIIDDIIADINIAQTAISSLPAGSKQAVTLSLHYYGALLKKLTDTPIETIKHSRVRINNVYKLWLYFLVRIRVLT